MRYGSVCSGIEAATVAWHPLGWQPQFFSEIEKFPCAVLKHHFPFVPNFGDMTKFKEWSDVGIDLLVGGTPCQSFSVAGLRQGLADPRGNLALVYLGVVDRYRPRWIVWENVPGVLSSNRGRDFGAFLGALGELGYGWAYRVLDAQHFGVPQRRRRVFVIGHLGNWRGPAAVLFERESVCGDIAKGRGQESVVASLTKNGVGVSGADDNQAKAGHLIEAFKESQSGCRLTGQVHATLDANKGSRRQEGICFQSKYEGAARVRRLTPSECERLQGFPADWTAISGASDSARYKAIGNSMAVPVMRWIGEGIAAVEASYQ